MKNLLNENWLTAKLSASVLPEAVDDIKKVFFGYAKKLEGWSVVVEEDNRISSSGELFMRVSVEPTHKTISPIALLAVHDTLMECTRSFMSDMNARSVQIFHDPLSGIELPGMTADELEGYWCVAFKARGFPYTNVLTYTFPARTRVLFDNKHPSTAQMLFGSTTKELVAQYQWHPSWFSRLLRGSEYVDALQRSRDRLKEWFGIDYDVLKNHI